VRGGEVVVAHHDTLIEAEDHVIVFVIDKKMLKKVEKLFQVSLGSSDGPYIYVFMRSA